MSKLAARDRLAEAALTLFDESGYDQTTVDDITGRAGLSRATFFRYYRSKDDVIFPDHDRLLEQVRDRLLHSSHSTALVAVSDAVRLVLLHYLEEGDLARRRYALTSTVPALRDREIASVARYQRLFREFISDWMGDPSQGSQDDLAASLRAELMSASVVSAHNHVLRRWLRGDSPDPVREVDDAMRQVIDLFAAPAMPAAHAGTTVAVFSSGVSIDAVLPEIRRLVGGASAADQQSLRTRRRGPASESQIFTIVGGASEIQRMIIGRSITGLNRPLRWAQDAPPPRIQASICSAMACRSSPGVMMVSMEPTSTARLMEWTASNSAAIADSFSARTAARTSASSLVSDAFFGPVVAVRRASSPAMRGSAAVRASTWRAKTTAAAGAPPMTEANEPSTASTVMFSLSALENTTKAPPW
jgi:AcrR family transcriptional regulator